MTEFQFIKAEGPEPPGAADLLMEKHHDIMAQATEELNRVSNALRHAESKLLDAYQLVSQLSGYLDSIEWGTHEEWTRSQSLRKQAHEYIGSFTYGFNIIAT